MTDDLLPPSATPQAKALAGTTKRLTDLPVPIDTLWDPMTCPAELLASLAWTLSVDHWNPDWPEATKRTVIAAAYDVHAYKGTPHAMAAALSGMGLAGDLIEWWQAVPEAPAGTFEMIVMADQSTAALTPAAQADALAAVDAVKRHSQHGAVSMGAGLDWPFALAGSVDPSIRAELEGGSGRDFVATEMGLGAAVDGAVTVDMEVAANGRDFVELGGHLVAAVQSFQVIELRS